LFGRENEHLFLRHIAGFIPRTRFEEGEGEEEEEEEELLRQETAKNQVALEEAQGGLALAQASVDTVQARQAQLQARIDALEQARGLRRKADSERGFPDAVERGV
jgi:chromosome condensin MukBEF ATPase and DNA-binding subunit MukB